jgi:hypothetical protein
MHTFTTFPGGTGEDNIDVHRCTYLYTLPIIVQRIQSEVISFDTDNCPEMC